MKIGTRQITYAYHKDNLNTAIPGLWLIPDNLPLVGLYTVQNVAVVSVGKSVHGVQNKIRPYANIILWMGCSKFKSLSPTVYQSTMSFRAFRVIMLIVTHRQTDSKHLMIPFIAGWVDHYAIYSHAGYISHRHVAKKGSKRVTLRALHLTAIPRIYTSR